MRHRKGKDAKGSIKSHRAMEDTCRLQSAECDSTMDQEPRTSPSYYQRPMNFQSCKYHWLRQRAWCEVQPGDHANASDNKGTASIPRMKFRNPINTQSSITGL